MRRLRLLGAILVLLLVFSTLPLRGGRAESAPSFVAVRSGSWDDPRTWGQSGTSQPDVTIPGPHSRVTIPAGTVVVLQGHKEVAFLTVQERGILRGARGEGVALTVTEGLVNDGAIVGGEGSVRAPAGYVALRVTGGDLINRGLIRGGDAGPYGGPGGWVDLQAHGGRVENWGAILGGKGAATYSDGWVRVRGESVVRHRGEARGSDVLLHSTTVDTASGRVIAVAQTDDGPGDAFISAVQAIFAGGRSTRVAGQGVFLVMGNDGLLDLQDVETMGILARARGLWFLGGPGARLYATGNSARFPPFQALGGAVHLWVDASQRYLDENTTWPDLVTGAVDQGPGREISLPRLLVREWQKGAPGQTISLRIEVVNAGNRDMATTLHARDTQGWPIVPTLVDVPALGPGEGTIITLTVDVPVTATVGTENVLVLSAGGVGNVLPANVRVPLEVAPWEAHLPMVGRWAVFTGESQQAPSIEEETPPTVSLSWAGEAEGKPLQGRSLLVVSTSADDMAALDLSYWNGMRWVPIATTVDMDNFAEDGVRAALWDTSLAPLTSSVLVRARVWTRSGTMGTITRQVRVEHPPRAVGTATFGFGTTVTLDARASSDLEGPIVAYRWDLGDGTVVSDPTITHTFAPGRFTVRLTVTDTVGLSAERVYLLDVSARSWQEQVACGCTSIRLKTSGPSPLPLPWEDAAHQSLGPDTSPFVGGRMLRVNLAVEASLTPESNAMACRVEQSARGIWRVQTPTGLQEREWRWGGQGFPGGDDVHWGLVGYTGPSTLLSARGTRVQWVLSPGWGWRSLGEGLPASALSGAGVRLEMAYRARVAGSAGSCTCTWEVVITARDGQEPQVTINGGC